MGGEWSITYEKLHFFGRIFQNYHLRIFDSDGNGSLDFKEFLMALDIAQCQDERQKLEWSFRYLVQIFKYT